MSGAYRFIGVLVLLSVVFNLVSFTAFGIDKLRAVHGKWRISEAALLGFAALGAAGAWLGMRVFRHKTKKAKFAVGVPLLFFGKTALLVFGVYLILSKRVSTWPFWIGKDAVPGAASSSVPALPLLVAELDGGHPRFFFK